MSEIVNISVSGGYNGGAVISAKLDGVEWFNAVGNSPYNLLYDNYIGTISTMDGDLDLLVNPPETSSADLVITLSGALVATINVGHLGSNTSYGYDFTRDYIIGSELPITGTGYLYTIYLNNTPVGTEVLYNTDVDLNGNAINIGTNIRNSNWVKNLEIGAILKFVLPNTANIEIINDSINHYSIVATNKNGIVVDSGIGPMPTLYICTCADIDKLAFRTPSRELNIGEYVSGVVDSSYTYSEFFGDVNPVTPTTDPYSEGGTSTTGGGTGNFDLSSDAIDFPGLPTLSAVSTGLISLYTPTITQLNALASYLWNADVTTVDWWKKLVANPLDLILGLSIVPVAAPQGASNNIKVGLIDTGVSMPRCASQYVEVDCGSLNVSEFWGSALDYAPFRKHSIYLPFIGTRSINTDDIMGKAVSVVYHIDLLSGAATAMIKAGESVLYQYSGACAISVPLSGQTFTDMITSTIQLAAAIGATVATGGAAAGITAASAANSVMSMKPTIERAGGVSGAAGQLGIMTPYLIGEIPRQSVPENYNQFAGYPSNIKSVLGELSGYTEVETVYLTNIIATSGELGEIESLLKQGVFINES